MNGMKIGLYQFGNQEYTIGGVKYIVSSEFRPLNKEINIQERFKKLVESDFAHLTEAKDPTTMADEYVCLTAGEED